VLRCPECDSAIQTLDLPCPFCTERTDRREDLEHTFSKTFEVRTAYRYRPDDLVHNVNRFLSDQRGLARLGAHVHLDRQGLVGGITLHCVSGPEPSPSAFQFARVRLADGFLLPRRRKDLGAALNAWSDAHADCRRLNNWVITMNGRPVETWILYATQRHQPIELTPPQAPPRTDA
jgi:hypothetical protein